jgi:hypothetical protein
MRRSLLTSMLAAGALAASAAPSQAAFAPGNNTEYNGASCTSNFLFRDGTRTFVGSAAHCVAGGESTTTNGCEAPRTRIGDQVTVRGASRPATIAYSSWNAMQDNGEDPSSEACAFNDFALYELDPVDAAAASPTVPRFGGPQGVGTTSTGEQVFSYQNSALRGGISLLSPKNGVTVSTSPEGWSHTVYTITPGIPGDSGSGYLNDQGQAFGVLSTVALAPLAGSNGVSDLGKAMAYARANGFPNLQLVDGTAPFRQSLLGLT